MLNDKLKIQPHKVNTKNKLNKNCSLPINRIYL